MDKVCEELKLQAERLEAVNAIRNIMGKYSFYHTAFRNKEYVEFWSNRDDCEMVMPFGIFDGGKSIKSHYVDQHCDRSMPGIEEDIKGAMMVHQMSTEVIEVAADGKTAKGIWVCPGIETMPHGDKAKGCWCWGKYEMTFIKEDGEWKIWKHILYPLFMTPVDRSWAEPALKMDGTYESPKLKRDRSLPKPMYSYSTDAIYPSDEPVIPLPYESCPGV